METGAPGLVAGGVHFCERGRRTARSRDYRNRVLKPLAEALELPKLTFQVLRRTMPTRAQDRIVGNGECNMRLTVAISISDQSLNSPQRALLPICVHVCDQPSRCRRESGSSLAIPNWVRSWNEALDHRGFKASDVSGPPGKVARPGQVPRYATQGRRNQCF